MLGEDLQNDPRKKLLKIFKERPSQLEKYYSQDLVKQTVEANTWRAAPQKMDQHSIISGLPSD